MLRWPRRERDGDKGRKESHVVSHVEDPHPSGVGPVLDLEATLLDQPAQEHPILQLWMRQGMYTGVCARSAGREMVLRTTEAVKVAG